MIIQEIKRHLNKPDEVYWCHLLHRENGYVVVSYVTKLAYTMGPVEIAPESETIGHYWADRGYVLWTIYGPNGTLKGHLFHVSREVQIGEDRIEYVDLLLDLWFHPDGTMLVLDEDELEACRGRGNIDERDVRWIAAQRAEIEAHGTQIIGKAWRYRSKGASCESSPR